jgi:hypothetical protein
MSMPGAVAAFAAGFGRVRRAPAVLIGACTVTLLVALPLSLALRGMLEAHLGASLAADAAAAGTNPEWWHEFTSQASGLGVTFLPSIIGAAAVVSDLSNLLDNTPLAATIAGATAAWLLLWSFLGGGVLDRLARDRATRSEGFFAACGVHFWRLLRLGVLGLAAYGALFRWVHPKIFDVAPALLFGATTTETSAAALRAGGYLLFGALLIIVNVVFDYARIRIVVEDRHSAVAALGASLRFVRRQPGRVLLLYAVNGLAFLILIAAYALLNPGAPGQGLAMWGTLLFGQLYIVARHYLKLTFYASEIALFQSAASHAGYTAAPPRVWPESPSAEAVRNAAGAAAR